MKKALLVMILFAAMVVLCACTSIETGNRVIGGKDVQTFTYAYIKLGDQTIVEGYVNQWRDYADSDTVQIMIDGKYYLTHYSCVVMIADPAHGNMNYGVEPTQDLGGK